jgi:hypothetical protein
MLFFRGEFPIISAFLIQDAHLKAFFSCLTAAKRPMNPEGFRHLPKNLRSLAFSVSSVSSSDPWERARDERIQDSGNRTQDEESKKSNWRKGEKLSLTEFTEATEKRLFAPSAKGRLTKRFSEKSRRKGWLSQSSQSTQRSLLFSSHREMPMGGKELRSNKACRG